MNFVVHPPTLPDREKLGGKAAALARLRGLPIPPWIAVTPSAFHASAVNWKEPNTFVVAPGVAAEITTALAEILPKAKGFAVRSSAVDEDGAAISFAGQLESFLNVPASAVHARVADVWRSGFSERLQAYRRKHHLPALGSPPAVLIQQMILPSVAGVAFSADPVSGQRGVAVVSAVAGLGDKLVSGEADADTFHVDRAGNITSHPKATSPGRAPVLRDDEIRKVAALARAAEQQFGVPQDIEWAIDGNEVWLLQSRPITTLKHAPDPDGLLRIWDNSNIAESYGGITTPLTYSFARRAYEEVYRQFCRLMRVPEPLIAANADTFRCMIGLVRGRVYYNLGSWYRVLSLLPGYAVNRSFMEQMMGVKESLPEEALDRSGENISRLRDGLNLCRTVAGLVWNHFTLERQIAAFYGRLNEALQEPEVPLPQMRPDELATHYRQLERQLLTRWDAPLVNDFFAMIFYGVLRKQCARRGNEAFANELIRDAGDIISAEPARRIQKLAELARPHPQLVTALQGGTAAEIENLLMAFPEFAASVSEYLAKFGERCLDELKLESATLNDDPAPLYRSIGTLASIREPTQLAKTPPTESVVSPTKGGPLFCWITKHARARIRSRENLRFERTRLFGRVRRIFVELGKRLHASGCLEDPTDVFHLDLNEILGYVDGTTTSADLGGLAAVRKAEFKRYHGEAAPPDRFTTRGVVHQSKPSGSPPAASVPVDASTRTGLPCCSGIVRGRVRVITDPHDARLEAGEILVAERTDPGWILLFPAAAGVLVERGSLLSHAAIVTRELGLPGIVSITGLTAWLKTGDIVVMDGATGRVTRIEDGTDSRI